MFLRCITIKGVTRLYFYESHFCDGKSKQTCVECLGRLDELQKQFQDPVAHFKKVAEERTNELKNAKTTTTTIDMLETLEIGEDDIKNVGYVVLKDLYKELELDKFWKRILAKTSIKYDLESVFRLLVFSRILYPGSKKETFDNKDVYFENIDGFSLKDMYRALDVFDEYSEELQKWIYQRSSKICARDMSVSYFCLLYTSPSPRD